MDILFWFGVILFLHDLRDFPKVDRLHHWQIGGILAIIGAQTNVNA